MRAGACGRYRFCSFASETGSAVAGILTRPGDIKSLRRIFCGSEELLDGSFPYDRENMGVGGPVDSCRRSLVAGDRTHRKPRSHEPYDRIPRGHRFQ